MIKISLVASSIRPFLWMDFYNSLSSNEIEYEIIFVGDVKPNFELPKEIKYIYSPVKPVQCYQIGFRESKGELIHWTSDETIYQPKALDIIYSFFQSFNDKRIIVGFKVKENNGISFSITSTSHKLSTPDSPQMACFGVIRYDFMRYLGGYDQRFITGQAENDLCMRCLDEGGKIYMCDEAEIHVYHNKAHKDNYKDSKFRKWYSQSRAFLEECWFIDGVWCPTRVKPFLPFNDKELLKITQGPKGDW